MDFFQSQDKARRNTKLLVFYFVVAVVLIVLAVYFACLFVFHSLDIYSASKPNRPGMPAQFSLWNPQLFLYSAGGALAIIVFGSMFKMAALSSGGSAVAESLGGRLINPNTADDDERKLLNVVEEMALASGVAVPRVYLLEHERGINAFAAGHSISDAAIGVTRGCVQTLSRDELQGVIAHEFSHILNGDMRLNLRLMGIIFGIVCITVIGRILLYTGGRRHCYSLGARNRGGNPLPLLGLLLIVIGWVGVIFARLIQSAVSRQREYLADAAAVQFTRNPSGIAGALKKIGGLSLGSRLQSAHAEEASHMFFGNGMGKSFLNAWSTHPPLKERIRAIDPGWDGKYPHVTLREPEDDIEQLLKRPQKTGMPPIFPFPQRSAASAAAFAALSAPPVRPQTVLPNLGNPTPMHLRYAQELRAALPENLLAAAHHPQTAMALVYALLLSDDDITRASQLKELSQRAGSATAQQVEALYPDAAAVGARARLPMVEIAIPALRQLQPDEFERFNSTLKWLIESDRQVDLFEFVLQKIISRHLAPQFGKARRALVQFYTFKPLLPDAALLLSALAQVGSGDSMQIESAYQKGVPYLRCAEFNYPLLPRSECSLDKLGGALDRLSQAVPQIKKNVIEACVHVVGADGLIQEREAELLRAVADSLDCPIPPFVTMD